MRLLPFCLAVASLSVLPIGALDLVIVPGSGLQANPAALAAFERAAMTWEGIFSDPITVTIEADLLDLGSTSILGQASSVNLYAGYDSMRGALLADAADEADDGLVAFLPTASQLFFTVPAGITLSGEVMLTKANAKALGYSGLDSLFGVSDGTIEFNSTFAFDYDRADGVGGSMIDFESVALHEIGHTLGFISAVDYVDYFVGLDPAGGVVDVALLDLFRFQNGGVNDPATLADFATMPRYLVPGGDAILDTLDAEYGLSTGLDFGDGRQASHWKDNDLTGELIGLMDPTLAYGQEFPVAAPDIRLLDLIGWDAVTVPEGRVWGWMVGAAFLAMRRRRNLLGGR